VTLSISLTAVVTCEIPVACSLTPAAISRTISLTFVTDCTIPASCSPTLFAVSSPSLASHRVDAPVEVRLDRLEVAPVLRRDLGWHVALRDALDVVGGHPERLHEGVDGLVQAGDHRPELLVDSRHVSTDVEVALCHGPAHPRGLLDEAADLAQEPPRMEEAHGHRARQRASQDEEAHEQPTRRGLLLAPEVAVQLRREDVLDLLHGVDPRRARGEPARRLDPESSLRGALERRALHAGHVRETLQGGALLVPAPRLLAPERAVTPARCCATSLPPAAGSPTRAEPS
jgi:hypothetical protein